jgi:L-rhamnose mutarotase
VKNGKQKLQNIAKGKRNYSLYLKKEERYQIKYFQLEVLSSEMQAIHKTRRMKEKN